MYKTILLTVDLGDAASWKKALPAATEIARESGGTLHVLSVVPDFGSPLVAQDFPRDFQKNAVENAKARLQQLLGDEIHGPLNVVPHVAVGRVHEVVLEHIEATGAELVVMASHAPDRVREFLVGSQADRVVRRSPVSVLVVR
ncbi:MAG: universal stress protein [Albidovulum sp.]|uniref:universal stress protein n=1 Tax=Albidovulum sp. TaxID=1872424 RepID=UPI00132B121F|nr:universal stress protein [Defluviimonas sp.]KAB2884411.1 MAG: universal stress protein [Defluviimonas sp.]